MQITRIGTVPSYKGPEEWFTGSVRVDAPFEPNDATTGMSHIATQENLNGKVVDWLEHVTEEDYLKK